MLASAIPVKIQLPFAASGDKVAIPVPSQIAITDGRASFTTGFPPLNATPLSAGGVAPFWTDFNGLLNQVTAIQQWQSAGGIFKYDSDFSASIGGYPKGAILQSADGSTQWLCLADSNTTDPDSNSAVNWAPLAAYGVGTVSGLSGSNATLTPAQYGKSVLVLSGTLTANIQLTFPKFSKDWRVVNATTGAFTVSALTSGGAPVVIGQGAATVLRGDGTNVLMDALNVSEPASSDNSTKAINSKWAKIGLSFNLAPSGYVALPAWLGGWMLQWGTFNTSSGGSANTFPTAFPTAFYSISIGASGTTFLPLSAGSITTSGFIGYSSSSGTHYYMAVGK